jgi:hypothetical protein
LSAGLSHSWGTEPNERKLVFPCDGLIQRSDAVLYRAVTINAPAAVLFRWLCQLRVAPYSYDWIDNLGRQSPRRLIPGLEELARGQKVMEIFELVDFARDEHLTIRLKQDQMAVKVFGDVAVSYLIIPRTSSACRLVVKVVIKYRPTLSGNLMSVFLPWGDLIMMRRQLLNLKHLSEQTASTIQKIPATLGGDLFRK